MADKNTVHRDVIIIGGGIGGIITATYLSRLGLKVTLIEKEAKLGGAYLYNTTIPSKVFLSQARILWRYHNFFSTKHELPTAVNMQNIMQEVQRIIDNINTRESERKYKNSAFEVIYAQAQFLGRDTISVNDTVMLSRYFVIATGASPMIPPIPGLDKVHYHTVNNILSIQKIPKRLLIMGAGYTGIEYAQSFARLGAAVTLIDTKENLLAEYDQDFGIILEKVLKHDGVKCIFGAKVIKVTQAKADQIEVTVENAQQNTTVHSCDQLLVATGLAANVDNLGLEHTKVECSEQGIITDEKLRTSQKHIYAVGNVVACDHQYVHVAVEQAHVISFDIAFRFLSRKKINYEVIPSVCFSDPGFAHVGATETHLQARKIWYKKIIFNFRNIDRAVIENYQDGQLKLLVKSKRIIGATVIGPGAGELIALLTMAIVNQIKITKLIRQVYPYPSEAQVVKSALEHHLAASWFGKVNLYVVRVMRYLFG